MNDTTSFKSNTDTTNDFSLNSFAFYRTVHVNINKIPEYFKVYIDVKNEKRKELYYRFNTRYSGRIW
jgi:hypothetical protein